MKLTFDQLNSQLNKAEERKSKLIAEKQERIKTMSSGRAPLRPKTAAPVSRQIICRTSHNLRQMGFEIEGLSQLDRTEA